MPTSLYIHQVCNLLYVFIFGNNAFKIPSMFYHGHLNINNIIIIIIIINKKYLLLYFSPALRFGRNAKIIHFIGPVKPWQHRYVPDVDTVILSPGSYATQKVTYDYIKRWWHVYNRAAQVKGSI